MNQQERPATGAGISAAAAVGVEVNQGAMGGLKGKVVSEAGDFTRPTLTSAAVLVRLPGVVR